MITLFIKHSLKLFIYSAFFVVFWETGTAFSQEKDNAVTNSDDVIVTALPEKIDTLNTIDKSKFVYHYEGRKDPFMPFITPKAVSLDMNEIIHDDKKLTGMQLFEPGQLTLVAILQRKNGNIAMVEDSTGKGYVVKQGTKIGRYGEITSIIPNKVIIVETKETRARQKIKTNVDMVLKKEGEE